MKFPDPPDPGWIPYVKLVFGFTLLIILGLLAKGIGLGKVEAATSHGLDIVLGGLVSLSGAFGLWAFQITKNGNDK
jgi:hypothetical protein